MRPPLMYESGWGRDNLYNCVSRDDVTDVTARYTKPIRAEKTLIYGSVAGDADEWIYNKG